MTMEEHTASVRGQENLLITQKILTKDISQDGGSLVARFYPAFQVAKQLIDINLLLATILSSLLRFVVGSPLLSAEKFAGYVAGLVNEA